MPKAHSSAGATGAQWIWGHHSIEACLENQPELILEIISEVEVPEKIARLSQENGLKIKDERLPRHLEERRSQGLAARLKEFPLLSLSDYEADFNFAVGQKGCRQWAALDAVQDPRNFGAILRSAAAFGVEAVFVAQKNQAPLNGVVAQASAGALFRLKIVETRNLGHVIESAHDKNLQSLALDGTGEKLEKVLRGFDRSDTKILWLLGSEGDGLREKLLEKSQHRVRIPIAENVESLNVSAAATIAFFAFSQLS